jgi:hypothetical protein
VTAVGGATVSVDGGPEQGGSFTASVPLSAGQELSFTARSGQGTTSHYVRCLPPDFPSWTAARNGTPEADWYIVTPASPAPYVIVFDNQGVPVWWMRPSMGRAGDAKLLPNRHLAWYAPVTGPFGTDANVAFEERKLDGTLVRKLSTVGSPTDQHDLQLLENGNHLLITYRPRDHVDLSPYGGPSDATVVDGEIQEINRSGTLVWSWSSKDHIALSETGRWYGLEVLPAPRQLGDGRTAYDIVHINALEPVGDHLLFSARYLDAVYEIDRTTGEIDWKLGGTTTGKSLTIAGDAFASQDFGGQHDVRLLADGTVTLHDNGSRYGRPPRALRFAIDTVSKTATLVEAVTDPDAPSSGCCGGARRLPGGHWVIAWGGQPLVTEIADSGERVFRLDFPANQFSYRADPVLPGKLSPSLLRSGMNAMFPR